MTAPWTMLHSSCPERRSADLSELYGRCLVVGFARLGLGRCRFFVVSSSMRLPLQVVEPDADETRPRTVRDPRSVRNLSRIATPHLLRGHGRFHQITPCQAADSDSSSSSEMLRNCSSAASRFLTISAASTSGAGRLSVSSRLSSLSQKRSRLALSRATRSS